MTGITLASLLLTGALGAGQAGGAVAAPAGGAVAAPAGGAAAAPAAAPQPAHTVMAAPPVLPANACCPTGGGGGLFQGDRAFPRFMGPISNPVLAKDPRSLTELRSVFINNWIPNSHPLGGGDFQVYAVQPRIALSERLQVFADKSVYAVINPGAAASTDGFINLAAGLKYALIRDVENQFILSTGVQYEPQTGEAKVFQGHGDGLFTLFGTVGKEFCEKTHFIGNFGYQFAIDRTDNSSFFYTSLHLDYQVLDWLYPLVELNWYRYTAGGTRGIPAAIGEGDGLLNLGTTGAAGNDLVTMAVGMKAILGERVQTGIAYEFPVSHRRDLIEGRLLVELILRY